MTATIDEQAVRAFIELAEKATPGPWELNATKSNQLTATPEEGRFGGPAGRMRGDFTGTNYITNLAFIAAARSIAPALAALYLEHRGDTEKADVNLTIAKADLDHAQKDRGPVIERLEADYKAMAIRAHDAEARVAELTAELRAVKAGYRTGTGHDMLRMPMEIEERHPHLGEEGHHKEEVR